MTSRLEPSFFIIGERKCGTSSLFRYILEHPMVLPGKRKEMQFFTRGEMHVRANFDEYLQAFPVVDGGGREVLDWPELDDSGILYEEQVTFERIQGRKYITGEASADTLCDADPRLLKELLPDLALLVVLRDPVERAFSHHRMFKRFHEEGRDLPFVPGEFASDMRNEMEALSTGMRTPCLSPSLYMQNLARWSEVWREQLLVIFSASLDDDDRFAECMREVTQHLGLAHHEYARERRYNQAPVAQMGDEIRQELRAFFAPHDRALEEHLGRPLPWPRS